MTQIVLKDATADDVIFTHVKTAPNTLTYVNRGDSLLDSRELTISLNENANTNRVRVKLSVPRVGKNADGKSVIEYTQVASSDITIVKFSTAEDRALIDALFKSAISSDVVSDLVQNGAFPV